MSGNLLYFYALEIEFNRKRRWIQAYLQSYKWCQLQRIVSTLMMLFERDEAFSFIKSIVLFPEIWLTQNQENSTTQLSPMLMNLIAWHISVYDVVLSISYVTVNCTTLDLVSSMKHSLLLELKKIYL